MLKTNRFNTLKCPKSTENAPDFDKTGAFFVSFNGLVFNSGFQQNLLKTLLELLKTRGNHVFSTFCPVENSGFPCQYLF